MLSSGLSPLGGGKVQRFGFVLGGILPFDLKLKPQNHRQLGLAKP